jgi:hypothetical protein
MIKVLRDIYVEAGEVERYFEGQVPVDLWRAKRKGALSPFEFVEEGFVLSNGRPRPADITILERGGVKWVTVDKRPRGLSTFDKRGVPPGRGWEYYLIPQGTELPQGLAISRDEPNEVFGATHYTIAPAYDMPLVEFKSLLLRLAEALARKAS